jgi:membrane fusion protein (multidrug efflux system)
MIARSPSIQILAAALVAPLAAACNRASQAEPKHTAAADSPPISVKMTTAEPIKVPRVITLSGTLTGAEQSRVAAGAAGKVVATFIERGAMVRKGAVMAKLDARAAAAIASEAAAQAESMKAQQAQADLDCDRNKQLFEKGAVSKADYDKIRTQCATSKWSVSAAEARRTQTAEALRDTEIRAPFTGMVMERSVTAGEYVRADSPVATLVDVENLRVELTVPEADVADVKQGMTVDFRVASDDKATPHHGRIRYIGPAVRQQTRDAVVEAVVDNAGHDLRPGMFVTARLALGEQSVPAVPAAAVRSDGPQRHVFVVVGDRVEDRLVQVGEARQGQVPVVDGIKQGEKVVAELGPDVRDGARVK